MKHNVYFLTSNEKKAKDFGHYGLGVKEFKEEIIEVLDPNVEVVALYKAKAVLLNNIVVEDTSLHVQGADFWGTQIKHVYDEIKNDDSFHLNKSIWEVCLCMKKDNNFYLATGKLEGVLKYPQLDHGYHFDRIFSVKKGEEYIQFELLSPEEKIEVGPRFQALRKLSHALETNDYSNLTVLRENDIPEWTGEYQVEKKVHKYKP